MAGRAKGSAAGKRCVLHAKALDPHLARPHQGVWVCVCVCYMPKRWIHTWQGHTNVCVGVGVGVGVCSVCLSAGSTPGKATPKCGLVAWVCWVCGCERKSVCVCVCAYACTCVFVHSL